MNVLQVNLCAIPLHRRHSMLGKRLLHSHLHRYVNNCIHTFHNIHTMHSFHPLNLAIHLDPYKHLHPRVLGQHSPKTCVVVARMLFHIFQLCSTIQPSWLCHHCNAYLRDHHCGSGHALHRNHHVNVHDGDGRRCHRNHYVNDHVSGDRRRHENHCGNDHVNVHESGRGRMLLDRHLHNQRRLHLDFEYHLCKFHML
eukprot:UN22231